MVVVVEAGDEIIDEATCEAYVVVKPAALFTDLQVFVGVGEEEDEASHASHHVNF